MRYLFLILFFIANFASATRGQGFRWPSEISTSTDFILKQKKEVSGTPIVSIGNYTLSKDNSEDSEGSDEDIDAPILTNHNCHNFWSRILSFEEKSRISIRKVREKLFPTIPIFLRDSRFLI
jgi:hypothetical protein